MSDAASPLRLMVWNLCRGGQGTAAGDVLDLIGDVVADVAPDVLCCTETLGATYPIIERCAGRGRPGYRGYRLASTGSDDNLAIITRLPVVARLPYPVGRTVDSYNLGGVRLALPRGGRVNVFDTWLRFDVAIAEALEQAATEMASGHPRTRSDEELALLELPQLANIEEILTEHVPASVPDENEPVILAGGFNTESHLDWPDDGPQWQVTRRLAKAGFTDAYRAVHPDPGRSPGGTFNTLDAGQRLTHRIDYAFVAGTGVEVTDVRVLDTRLPVHGAGPFYSDHAALVFDLLVPDVA